jgi:cellulose synthase/poly-beta-1,6-N-acetylglucosamine synthase-like glycosyltransferase
LPQQGSGREVRTQQLSWRRRAARLGWVSAGLAMLSAAMFAVAIWVVATEAPRVVSSSQTSQATTALLPVDVHLQTPRLVTTLSVCLALAASLVGVAAFQTATAMQVLRRDRRIPEPLPAPAAKARRRILGALLSGLGPDPLLWPASTLPPPQPADARRTRLTVFVPAHNEQAVLGRTLLSLDQQNRPAQRVVVVADNCTDETVPVAREHGAEVIETVGNTQQKAGALNQVLAAHLASVDADDAGDVVMVMDADSTITPEFLETALDLLESDPDLVAVGGLFFGELGNGVLGQLQRNEFARYQRILGRREGRVFVLTGTASLFRTYALRAVSQTRGSLFPGTPGEVYDTLAMTEDNELTLALKTLGGRMRSPAPCRVTTEVMSTWRDLFRQRLRWQRGGLENVGAYGLTRTTDKYWVQQVTLAYGVIALNSYLALMTIALLAADSFRWSPFWLAVGAVFMLERLVTVWAVGWRGRLLALPMLFEIGYALFLQVAFVWSLVQIATGRKAGWNYVPRETLAVAPLPVAAAVGAFAHWSPLPSSVLTSTWFEALTLFVGLNTLVFVVLSIFQMLPPIVRTWHRLRR